MDKADKIRIMLVEELRLYYEEKCFFQKNKDVSKFVKEYLNREDAIFLNQSSIRMHDINFNPKLYVVHHEMNKIKKRIIENEYFEKEGFYSPAILTGIRGASTKMGNEKFNKTNRFSIRIESEIEVEAQKHIQYMETVGFPFLEKVSTIEGIDWYYNDSFYDLDVKILTPFEKNQKIRGWLENKLINGLIAGKLAQPEKFEQLVSVYRNLFYQDWQQEFINKIIPKLIDDVC